MSCKLRLLLKDGTQRDFKTCIAFSFEKELYMPFTKASGIFWSDVSVNFGAWDVMTVQLFINGELRHSGMPDSLKLSSYAGGTRIDLSSRGYTLLLMQNEPYPEINTNVTLKSLVEENLTVPQITCEDPTPEERYIYVKEKTSVWDAVTAYSIKAVGNYPYIRGCNDICVTIGERSNFNLSSCDIIDEGTALDTSNILSDVHMIDADFELQYDAHDSSAVDIGIVRSKYYPLDQQWLYSPDVGLNAKFNYSNRGIRSSFLTYAGALGEDLMDTANNCSLDGKRISYVRVRGNKNGIFTTLKAYDDRYAQRD